MRVDLLAGLVVEASEQEAMARRLRSDLDGHGQLVQGSGPVFLQGGRHGLQSAVADLGGCDGQGTAGFLGRRAGAQHHLAVIRGRALGDGLR